MRRVESGLVSLSEMSAKSQHDCLTGKWHHCQRRLIVKYKDSFAVYNLNFFENLVRIIIGNSTFLKLCHLKNAKILTKRHFTLIYPIYQKYPTCTLSEAQKAAILQSKSPLKVRQLIKAILLLRPTIDIDEFINLNRFHFNKLIQIEDHLVKQHAKKKNGPAYLNLESIITQLLTNRKVEPIEIKEKKVRYLAPDEKALKKMSNAFFVFLKDRGLSDTLISQVNDSLRTVFIRELVHTGPGNVSPLAKQAIRRHFKEELEDQLAKKTSPSAPSNECAGILDAFDEASGVL